MLGFREENIPQAFGARFLLQLVHDRRALPAVALFVELPRVDGLGRIDVARP